MDQSTEQGLNAKIGFNGDFYHVDTMSGHGILIVDNLFESCLLSKDVTPEMLGSCLKKSLKQSRIVDPGNYDFFDYKKVKERYEGWIKNIIKLRGYKNKKSVFKQMNKCSIVQLDDLITIRPLNHVKLESWSGDGISETDYVIIPVSASDDELGYAVIEAFSRCKGRQF
ncbi:contact-dependent growth inhibition system immunity protein [Morganella morganii]|uniref:contact-dependent growth inhibition system immunity protein n=1 Tax=Morganella morganii TaxID=582 RepID=UPI00046888AD|nr:contact-dependent growth inhibition system immunity protein [Morganella morganii]